MRQRRPWHEVATRLVDVAAGREPAELVIRHGRWVNVLTREVVPDIDMAVSSGRIACIVEDASYCTGAGTRVIEAEGRFLVPGLTDAHMHVESSMCTITEYVRAVLPHGTTAIFADPHEIANVFGIDGVRMMAAEAAAMPINVFLQVPSCVPSAPGLETSGARITAREVQEAMSWPGVIGLGEMMNFPGLAGNDPQMHAEVAATMRAGKTVGGHYASPDLGRGFHGYLAGGPADDHENVREVDAVERARRGLRPMLRFGSAWHDVAAQITAVTERGLDPRRFILCTDDVHAATLVREGHMDRVLRHAVGLGCDPLVALQMMTINTAEHFGVERDLGCLAPGRYADLVVADSLENFTAGLVITGGEVAAEAGRLLLDLPAWTHEERFRQSVRIPRRLSAGDFVVPAGVVDGTVTANVIGVLENQAPTRRLTAELAVAGGAVRPDLANDVLPLALVERHRGSGAVVNGFVHGFGFQGDCAVASTVAHDSHHLLVMGTDSESMARAANTLAGTGGGVVVVRGGEVAALVELPVGGLMSDERAEVVAAKSARVMQAMRDCGCTLNNGYMQLSLLALVVIPELRISDLGLVDVSRFAHIPVIR
ncbi:MAG: amidohydrolase family protein [Spirochaetaceae bacterium]|nr:amidohydrolase family protein [Spirochaetaceae bacterium]